MNTDVTVIAPGADEEALAATAASTFLRVERRFSRFREDSELSWLNRSRGPVTVSEQMFDVLMRARRYVEMTDGLFEPAVGGALMSLGYDRSFAPGALDRAHEAPAQDVGRFLDVVLDASSRRVERPENVHIDLGGMLKGRTVDVAAASMPPCAAIDAGGDAILRGRGPSDDGWRVDVEDPSDAERTVLTLVVSDRAVATSAPNRRRWYVDGHTAHHLIDPRTQRPASTDLAQATVLASTAELADVLAKTAFLLGSADAQRFLAGRSDVGAVLVRDTGDLLLVGDVEVEEAQRG